jgi:iron complex outermembrane recepter protein
MKNSLLVIAGVATITPLLAWSQQEQLSLEEVIVTAQRRVESVQDVPISVSVFSAEDLQKANVTEAKNYLQFAPNVSFTEDGQVGNRGINISIRGASDVSLGEVVTANSIGFYVDEFNVGTVANGVINPQLQDVERIEVLRGPQGTYFGRNALAGALNITTKKPEQTFYAEGSARLEKFNTWGLGGVLNVPLADSVAVRLVADYDKSDGLVENVNPAGRGNSGYEDKHARLALRVQPSDKSTFDLSLSYTEEQNGFDAEISSGVLDLDTQSIFGSSFRPIDDQLGFYPANQEKVNHDAAELNDNQFLIANARYSYQFDDFELRSISGYIDSESDRFFDQDNISVDTIVRENHYDGTSYSQELRLQSTGERRLDWTFGGLYARDEITQFNSVRAGSQGSYTDPRTGEVIGLLPPIPAGFRINENNRVFQTTSYAVFGDLAWHLDELWTLTVGARYTHDEIDNRLSGVVNFEAPPLAGTGSDSFTDFSPRVVLRFEPSQNLTWYASVSKGYKAGGVDVLFVPSAGDPDVQVPFLSSFDPEEMRNYEIGMKALLADGRVRLSTSAFYLDWQDMQVQTAFLRDPTDISSSVETTLNASAASTKGIEAELLARLSDRWQVGLGAGYLDGKFDEFPNAVLSGANTLDMSNARLPNAPKFTGNAFAEYEFDIAPDLSPFVRAEWIHREESAGDLEGSVALSGRPIQSGANAGQRLPEFPYVIPSYDVVNLRVGIGSDAWDVQAYVENLLEEDYYNGTSDNFGLGGIRLRPHPRLWGIKLVYRMK